MNLSRTRIASDGTVWGHMSCPYCADHSLHYGVGKKLDGSIVGKCLRCGTTKLPDSIRQLYGSQHKATRLPAAKVHDRLPGLDLIPLTAAPRYIQRRLRRYAEEQWPKLSWNQIATHAWVGKDNAFSLFFRPYNLEGQHCVIERRFLGKPKYLTCGVSTPPYFLCGGYIDGIRKRIREGSPLVYVEGLLDTLAIPTAYVSGAVLGGSCSKTAHLSAREHIIATDGDSAGRDIGRTLAKGILLRGGLVSYARLPLGSDPASCGTRLMKKILGRREKVSTIKDFLLAFEK